MPPVMGNRRELQDCLISHGQSVTVYLHFCSQEKLAVTDGEFDAGGHSQGEFAGDTSQWLNAGGT